MDLTRFKECPAIKNSVYVDNQSKVAPCCYFKSKLPIEVLSDWNNYQTELAKIDIETGCEHCIKLENSGVEESHRNRFVHRYKSVLKKDELEISISVDNVCNLKCTTCNPINSSLWLGDAIKLNSLNPNYNLDQFLSGFKDGNFKLDICKKIIESYEKDITVILYGGEPTINNAVIDFLEWLTELPNAHLISITFITNGTTVPKNIENYINKFKMIDINLSLDSINERSDFLRFRSQWKELEQNAIVYDLLALKYKNFEYRIHLTLSLLNVYYFYEFCNWVNNTLNNVEVIFTKLIGPRHLSLDLLNPKQKQIVINHNLNLLNKIESKGLQNINQTIKNYEQMVETYIADVYKDGLTPTLDFLTNLDDIRSTAYKVTFPEIVEILNNE
jgi:hypothetical protein